MAAATDDSGIHTIDRLSVFLMVLGLSKRTNRLLSAVTSNKGGIALSPDRDTPSQRGKHY